MGFKGGRPTLSHGILHGHVAPAVSGVGDGAAEEEKLHHLHVPLGARQVQRRSPAHCRASKGGGSG